MSWIESHQAVLWHRKTGRLMRSLGLSRVAAVGHLHAFWWWCMDNASDGVLDQIDVEDIADGALWEGDPREFFDALHFAGWIDQTETGYSVHEWMDYAGKLLERRRQDAKRKRDARLQHVQGTSVGRPKDGVRTVPNHTVPNHPAEDGEESLTAHAREAPPPSSPPSAASSPATSPSMPEKELPPHLPEAAKERHRVREQVLTAAADLRGRKLTRSEEKVVNGWLAEHIGGLSPPIVEEAERETAKYTDGDCLEYFFRVMQRMIERPNDRAPSAAGGIGGGNGGGSTNGTWGKAHRGGAGRGDAQAQGAQAGSRPGGPSRLARERESLRGLVAKPTPVPSETERG